MGSQRVRHAWVTDLIWLKKLVEREEPKTFDFLEVNLSCIFHLLDKRKIIEPEYDFVILNKVMDPDNNQWQLMWEIDGETVETVSDFIFWGSKITAGGDCSMKLKDAYSLQGKLWLT